MVTVDGDLVQSAVGLSQSAQLSFWDALVLRAAARGGCDVVFTEDLQHGFRVDGLEIRNPFRNGDGAATPSDG